MTESIDDALAALKDGNYAKAIKLAYPLAKEENAIAQNILGDVYYYGEGAPQYYTEAKIWYEKSAEQGIANAQCNLGTMYRKGLGTPKDLDKAKKWYRMAAEQGNAKAQYNFGVMYEKGVGWPPYFVMAHMLYNLAAAQGLVEAKNARDLIAEQMTSEDIDKAQKKAFRKIVG